MGEYVNYACVCSVAQSCLTLCNAMDSSPSGSFVHGISQARILEWVAISFPRGSSQPRDQTRSPCIGREILYCTTWKPQCKKKKKIEISFNSLASKPYSNYCLDHYFDKLSALLLNATRWQRYLHR